MELDGSGRGDARHLLIRGADPGHGQAGRRCDRRGIRRGRLPASRSADRFSSPPFANRSFVSIRRSRPAADRGDAARGTVSARYLFGGTMARRPVKWTMTRAVDLTCRRRMPEKFPTSSYAFGYFPVAPTGKRAMSPAKPSRSTRPARSTVTVPSDRDVDVAVPLHLRSRRRRHLAPAHRQSHERWSCPGALVHRPAAAVRFTDVAAGTSVDVVAVDPKGNAVAGVTVQLALLRIQWNSVRHAEGSGFYTWETERIEVPSGEWTVRTAAAPVHREDHDARGRLLRAPRDRGDAEVTGTRTDTSVYALGKGYTAWDATTTTGSARAGTQDVEAGRTRAHHDPVAVGIGDGAAHGRA